MDACECEYDIVAFLQHLRLQLSWIEMTLSNLGIFYFLTKLTSSDLKIVGATYLLK